MVPAFSICGSAGPGVGPFLRLLVSHIEYYVFQFRNVTFRWSEVLTGSNKYY